MKLNLAPAVILISTLFAACSSDNAGNSATSVPGGPGDFASDYRTSSLFFTQMSGPVKGTSPHGTTWIWYSSNIKNLIGQSSFVVPEGTTVIKEFDSNSDGRPGWPGGGGDAGTSSDDGIAVMIKKPSGYDSSNGDWYYDMRDVDGNIMANPPPGRIAMCISCHSGFKSTDYLAGTRIH